MVASIFLSTPYCVPRKTLQVGISLQTQDGKLFLWLPRVCLSEIHQAFWALYSRGDLGGFPTLGVHFWGP